ncbi:MAG: homoserine O-succinyltransferase [Acidobacteriaceae bacterium]
MPVTLNSNPFTHDRRTRANGHNLTLAGERRGRSSNTITIGLVNNMLDGALEATERQFLSLLESASDGISVRLCLYSLPGVPRNETGSRHILSSYTSADNLGEAKLDGLIVTGREPLAANLADEPYWDRFTKLVDWAKENTYSTIWSCLAAHAATQYMDDIQRVKSRHKRCGILDCARVSDHPLIAGTPSRFKLPHSRWNGLPEDELTARGYDVLTRAGDAGVDTFVRQNKSLFVFFQGHPEYERNTLLLEYRRDVARYVRGEMNTYPLMPRGYFDRDAEIELIALQHKARLVRDPEILAEVSRVLETVEIEDTWRPTAAVIYKNWLRYICAQKEQRLRDGSIAVEANIESRQVEGGMPTLVAAAAVSA